MDTVVSLLFLGSYMAVGIWSLLAVESYLRMYERVRDDSPKFSEYRRGSTDHERTFSDTPRIITAAWKAILKHQQNDELERVRRSAIKRIILLLAYFLAFPLIII